MQVSTMHEPVWLCDDWWMVIWLRWIKSSSSMPEERCRTQRRLSLRSMHWTSWLTTRPLQVIPWLRWRCCWPVASVVQWRQSGWGERQNCWQRPMRRGRINCWSWRWIRPPQMKPGGWLSSCCSCSCVCSLQQEATVRDRVSVWSVSRLGWMIATAPGNFKGFGIGSAFALPGIPAVMLLWSTRLGTHPMTPDHGDLLYEGKAKRIYAATQPDRVLVEFKNDATAFNAQKKAQLADKGRLNCQISARLFEHLEAGDSTHYLGLAADTWMVVQRVEIIPSRWFCATLRPDCRQTPIVEGTVIDPALLDYYYKDDALGDPLLTEAHIHLLGVVDATRLSAIEQLARRVNGASAIFASIDLALVDFKLELGLNAAGELLLADEVSPDTCRFWDRRTSDSHDRILDKDRFRKDLGGVMEAYGEVLERVQASTPNPELHVSSADVFVAPGRNPSHIRSSRRS